MHTFKSPYTQVTSFVWEGKHYKFQSLPFGLSSAPRVFTKTLKPVIAWLRQIGLLVYLDDMLFMHAKKDQLETMAPLLCRLFESLGFDGEYTEVPANNK